MDDHTETIPASNNTTRNNAVTQNFIQHRNLKKSAKISKIHFGSHYSKKLLNVYNSLCKIISWLFMRSFIFLRLSTTYHIQPEILPKRKIQYFENSLTNALKTNDLL